jgi:hypothetical protein
MINDFYSYFSSVIDRKTFPDAWNDFDSPEIKYTATKILPNTLLKKFYLLKLVYNYVCNCLLCPHCHL